MLDNIIGQKPIKDALTIVLESVKRTGDVCPGILFEGFSGGGKSTFARAIAGELNHDFQEINCGCLRSNLDSRLKFMLALEQLKTGDVFFLDETHSLPKQLQEILYTAVGDGYISVDTSGFAGKLAINRFTMIGATTHLGALTIPMQSRFKYVFRIDEYEVDEIAEMLDKEEGPQIDTVALAKFCRGNPRQAKNYLDWITRYCSATGKPPNEATICEAMEQRGVYAYGLTEHDVKYLRALASRRFEGVRALSHMINVEESTVKKTIEPYLLKLGLISIMSSMGGKRAINMEKVREIKVI